MRIGIGGLSCECSTFSPLLTSTDDLAVMRGNELLTACEVPAQRDDIEFIPLRRARALPGGPIRREFYDEFKTSFLHDIMTCGPLDGLFLDMHGAAAVVGIDDAEADFFGVVRDALGPEPVIGASYDLHGNLSPGAMNSLDFVSAYRTAPHLDRAGTIGRTLELISRCVRDGRKPVKALIPVPILLPGEKTSTAFEPAKGLYERIPTVIDEFDLLDASILIGYAWADEPRSTATVAAFGFEAAAAHAAAAALAENLWAVRRKFGFGVVAGPVDDCIDAAMRSRSRPVVISDSGDNPTAGGTGDVPFVLGRLIDANATGVLFAGIADAAAVEQCAEEGEGGVITLSLGGKLDPVHGRPLGITGRITAVTNRLESGAPPNRAVVIRIGGIDTIVTEKRTPFHGRTDFLRVGIDPDDYNIIVVKIGYLVPGLEEIAAKSILALSPGAVNQDFSQLEFNRIKRPMFPFDEDMEWQPPRNSIV